MGGFLKNYVNGEFVESQAKEKLDIINPATLEVLGETPLGTREDVDAAVKAAKEAFKTWSKTPVVDRVQPLFKLKILLDEHVDEIATLIVKEHGKTFKEAKGDILRGIQMVEVATGMPTIMQVENLDNIARDIDCHVTKKTSWCFRGDHTF